MGIQFSIISVVVVRVKIYALEQRMLLDSPKFHWRYQWDACNDQFVVTVSTRPPYCQWMDRKPGRPRCAEWLNSRQLSVLGQNSGFFRFSCAELPDARWTHDGVQGKIQGQRRMWIRSQTKIPYWPWVLCFFAEQNSIRTFSRMPLILQWLLVCLFHFHNALSHLTPSHNFVSLAAKSNFNPAGPFPPEWMRKLKVQVCLWRFLKNSWASHDSLGLEVKEDWIVRAGKNKFLHSLYRLLLGWRNQGEWLKRFTKNTRSTFIFKVISGYQLPKKKGDRKKSILDPYVKVEISGVPRDNCTQKTDYVHNNGMHWIVWRNFVEGPFLWTSNSSETLKITQLSRRLCVQGVQTNFDVSSLEIKSEANAQLKCRWTLFALALLWLVTCPFLLQGFIRFSKKPSSLMWQFLIWRLWSSRWWTTNPSRVTSSWRSVVCHSTVSCQVHHPTFQHNRIQKSGVVFNDGSLDCQIWKQSRKLKINYDQTVLVVDGVGKWVLDRVLWVAVRYTAVEGNVHVSLVKVLDVSYLPFGLRMSQYSLLQLRNHTLL